MIVVQVLQFILLSIFLDRVSQGTSKPSTSPTATAKVPLQNVTAEALSSIKDNEIETDGADEGDDVKRDKISIPTDNNNSEKYIEFRRQYANKMLTFMNLTIDPCEDYYEYACGNWKNVIEERQSQHKRSNLIDIVYQLGESVDKLLKQDNLTTEYETEWKLVQQLYDSCLQADLYPMKKSQEYLDVIKMIGGFPAVDSTWKAENFSWFNMSAHLTNYGIDSLINEEIMYEYPYGPYFKLPDLGFDIFVHSDNIAENISRGYTLNEKRMREYLTTYDVETQRTEQVIADIFEFLRQVLNITDLFDEDLDKCEELTNENSYEQWNNYFDIAWKGDNFNETAGYPCDFFYIELDKICEAHKEAAANYLAMKFLYGMDARLKDSKFQQEYCRINLQSTLPFLIDKFYMHEYFNVYIRDEIADIIREIRKSLRNMLEEADWLDEATRAEAFLKESTMIIRIGNMDDPAMMEHLIREMKNLSYVAKNYELNNVNLKMFKTSMRRYNGLHYKELGNSTKPMELFIAMQVNSFYYNVDNSINVMAGILYPPAYHSAWPNSLKFGTLGYLIGHEFTHGFDSVGAHYDSTGHNRYWWTKKSGKVFNERTNCYVDHYSSYLVPEINRNINGHQTKDENIADSGGLREALTAYRRHTKDKSKKSDHSSVLDDEKMPGLDLSPEQLFFLGFAQLWCAAYKEEHYWEELTNEHTMDKYRVLGALTNIEDFAKVYECPLGSKMNPKSEKCRLW